jgi:2,3-bisphosphoglycerate-independent phosphoglycerate mutase
MKKILFIVIDGLGDGLIPELENKTPLEAARTPNLDFLARQGTCGLIEPFKFDWQDKPESDTCHLALFGYEPEKYHLGRGVYEAFGIGVKLRKGDIALRANFATINDDLKIIDRRAGRIEATQSLVDALKGIEIEGVKFLLFKSYGHRAVLVLRNANLSAEISDSDPKEEGSEIKKVIAKMELPEAIFTARILNKYLLEIQRVLKNHPLNSERVKTGLPPANCILTRRAGKFQETVAFKEKYGLSACCIAGGGLYKGIGKILGMDLIEVEGANGFKNTNLTGKISAAKDALKNYDFVFLHIKAADSLAEDGNFRGKKEFIEKIDENLKPLLNLEDTLIALTGDHSTCSLLKRHCSEPLPILIWSRTVLDRTGEGVEKFSERTCRKGGLGEFKQLDLISKILNFAR